MKKIIVLLCAVSMLGSTSCKKKSSGSSSANGWKLGATTYTVKYATNDGKKQFYAMDGIPSGSSPTVNTCILTFSTLPTGNGTYKVVNGFSGTPLAANEVYVSGSTYDPGATYLSTGSESLSVTITVAGGKLSATIPAVWVKKTGGTDSLQLSGTITEQ